MKYILFFLVIFLGSCSMYTPPQEYNYISERVYEKSFDTTWDNIVDWFAEQHIIIKHMDKNSGFIEAEFTMKYDDKRGYTDCGTELGDHISGSHNQSCNMNITVRKGEQGTKVNISARYEANGHKFIVNGLYTCVSTGKLEKDIFDYIAYK